MDSDMRQRIVKKLKSCNKQRLIIFAGVIGICLILLSELVPSQPRSNSESVSFDSCSYIADVEEKTKDILSSINGVGKCKVMITLCETDESIYARNFEENDSGSSYSRKNEYVFYEDGSSDTPILLKQNFPKVQGVLIVCEGGDNIVVREAIISSVTSLFNISSNNVTVTKISENR